jgi:hypothetical protein
MDPVAAVWEDGGMASPPPLPHEAVLDDEPESKKSSWRVPLIIAGVVVGLPLLLVLMGLVYVWLAEDLPVTAEDRDVLVTAAWVQEHGFDVEVLPQLEVIEKSRDLDGCVELTYTYENDPLYIDCTITVDPAVSDARASYLVLTTGHAIGFSTTDLDMKKRPDLLDWGDQSKFGLLYGEGDTLVGNYFACRTGKRTFTLIITGVALDDSDELREFFLPILRRVKTYTP